MIAYSMPQFGHDVIALLDHLGLEQAVVGGTSLGANVALEPAVAAPERVRALVLEMPVLENGIAAAVAAFVPLALALRVSQPVMRLVAAPTRRIPRTHFLLDLLLDFVRRDPSASLAVLDGLTFGRIAPPADERHRLPHPTLVIGHPSDPIHPFSDADMTARETRRTIPSTEAEPGRDPLPIGQLSHHLDALRRSGLLRSRREWRFIYYGGTGMRPRAWSASSRRTAAGGLMRAACAPAGVSRKGKKR